MSLSLFDHTLTFGASYTRFEFVDRIASTSAKNVIDKDFQAFVSAEGHLGATSFL